MPDVTYDQHYRESAAACGEPFAEFAAFCAQSDAGTVLDLGCGQGRDALMFARRGHRVVGVDVSRVGLQQMAAVAQEEGLVVSAVLCALSEYTPKERFDIVVLDRVLHMLPAPERASVLAMAMDAVADGGHLLVAEGPKGLVPVRERVESADWSVVRGTRNRLIARR